ncbi:LAETG motif-containing sortase-dependent surface protein [Streptomyces sp. NPDC005931]|uniref:LAETG motif-containing sortase-dependent surface protein n=1 Tax=Streptomyces sp. NPDC005931 TaxID=3364737 RepID=UPI00369A6846
MKLRRAMVTAAATAVIAPLALLSAPAAFADGHDTQQSTTTSSDSTPAQTGDPQPNDTESTPSDDRSSPSDDESTPSDDQSTPSDDQSTPSDDQSTPSDDQSSPSDDESTPSDDESTPSGDPSSPGASPSPSASASTPAEEDDFCLDDEKGEAQISADLRSGLSGLPETVVAGSGWTPFTFNVSNRGDEEIKGIKPLVGVAAVGWNEEDYSGQITLQVFDKATGKWNTLADAAGEGATFPAFSLGAGQSLSYQLRLGVSGKVPDSIGLTGGFASYADEEGCWMADDPNGWLYFFDILAAGSDPGEPNDAKPQTGGMGELEQVSDVKVTGNLAETGAGSALPMIGLAGGVAVVAGAGAVFIVRRRKAGTEA